jgi:hypothetical protein
MLDESMPPDFYLDLARRMPVEEIARLLERTTWRLIDTAPRDGTPIIAWDIDPTTNPTGDWVVVRWRPAATSRDPGGGAWMIAHDLYTYAPSHWMPVPPQPPPPED